MKTKSLHGKWPLRCVFVFVCFFVEIIFILYSVTETVLEYILDCSMKLNCMHKPRVKVKNDTCFTQVDLTLCPTFELSVTLHC